MSHFIRKCVMEKEIYNVDLESFRDLQGLLSNATSNLNQIAKRVNQTGVIYKNDIDDIKKSIEDFSKELWEIHSLLLKRTFELIKEKYQLFSFLMMKKLLKYDIMLYVIEHRTKRKGGAF